MQPNPFYPVQNPGFGYPAYPFAAYPPQPNPFPQPSPYDPTLSLSDSMLAMKLQDQERTDYHKNQQAARQRACDDEQLARLLQQSESQKIVEAKRIEEQDQALALRLVLEEKEAERKAAEAEQKRKEEQKKKDQLLKDQALALKMQEEEKHKAATLEYAARMASPPKNTVNRHPVEIHRHYCGCAKNSCPQHNNHIFKIHDHHCHCGVVYFPQAPKPSYVVPNQGKLHVHGTYCCTINHIHSSTCFCHYESHRHTSACCQYDHVHTKFCHCSHK